MSAEPVITQIRVLCAEYEGRTKTKVLAVALGDEEFGALRGLQEVEGRRIVRSGAPRGIEPLNITP